MYTLCEVGAEYLVLILTWYTCVHNFIHKNETEILGVWQEELWNEKHAYGYTTNICRENIRKIVENLKCWIALATTSASLQSIGSNPQDNKCFVRKLNNSNECVKMI
jgi:hypothetical protein